MHRFYLSRPDILDDKVIISDFKQIHHIKNVLRLKNKDEIIIFDADGNEFNGLIEEISAKNISVKIQKKTQGSKGTDIKITIACAIPKGRSMEEIVDKLTQLGVWRIIPLKTKRGIVEIDQTKELSRLKRWQKIVVSASQQSGRKNITAVSALKDLKEVLSETTYDLKLLATLSGKRESLKAALAKIKPKNILVLIGPEGDFSDEEAALAKEAGALLISLGDLVLRVDTAAIAVASFIRFYANN
jgi:16S rRNA (uracil1498-N3)-methyltransferase